LKKENRASTRLDAENLLAYSLYDIEGNPFDGGMVKTINISRVGISILSKTVMTPGFKIELTIGVGDDIVKTTGIINNNQELDDGDIQIGIEFENLSQDDIDKIAKVYPEILK
jgi:hypothetical protein